MVDLIPVLLVGAGVAVLMATAWRTHRLIGVLSEKKPWPSVRNLIAFFAFTFVVYMVALVSQRAFNRDLIFAIVLLLSAVLMLIVIQAGYRTIRDIMRLDEFEQLVNTDSLTGLFNRRAILYLLNEEFRKAHQFGFPLSVAMVDIDDFQRINHKYGRETGDMVLGEIGHQVRAALRQIDVVGRYGDEELLCIFPSTAAEGARITAGRLQGKVRALQFIEDETGQLVRDPRPDQFKEGMEMTTSVGLVTLTPELTTPHMVLTAAMEALEKAQRRGPNRVVFYSGEGETPEDEAPEDETPEGETPEDDISESEASDDEASDEREV